jgi:hypothetical protein
VTLSLIFILAAAPLLARNSDILHLKKVDFDAFFNETDTWDWWYEDRECRLWHSPFVCWNQKTKTILVPDIRDLPSPKKKLPDSLANELKKRSKRKNPFRHTYLVTNDDMIYITLKYLMENKYPFVNWVKENCNHPESSIKFYIFDLPKNDRMDIYYCIEDRSGNLQFVTNTKSVGDSDCIEEWKSLLKVDFPDVRINVKISGLFGDRAIIDVSSPITSIVFFDIRKPSSPISYKSISRVISGDIPIIQIDFNLALDRDLEMIKTHGIWLGRIEKNARITYSSLYSLIFDFFQKTKARFENNTFELFCAQTSDFEVGVSDFTGEIENNDLPTILSFMKQIVSNRKKEVFVQLIGYADIKGKEEGEAKWKKKDFEVSILRAEKVKKWLEEKLKDLSNRVKFEAKGCEEEYYEYHDRCVEITFYLN